MADNKDDYQITDIDELSSEPFVETEQNSSELETADELAVKSEQPETSRTRRNALIAIIFVIFVVLFYKIISSRMTSNNVTSIDKSLDSTEISKPVVVSKITKVAPAVQPQETEFSKSNEQVMQKLAALEENQQAMRTELNAMSTTVVTINNTVNDLNNKLTDINQNLTTLATRIDDQGQKINLLTIKPVVKPVIKKVVAKKSYPKYYLQAVIPGRAWLIGQNGTTITIREGTRLPGYGIVKLIDPSQGQILTSSGKVIRFGDQDN